MKEIKREEGKKRILVKGKYIYNLKEFFGEKFDSEITGGSIRISEKEYKNINKKDKFLTHFNLQKSGHEIGKVYVLARILKNGYFKEDFEQLPDLSYDDVILGRCVLVREFLKYDQLKEGDFKYSFENIKNIDSLEKIIVERYSRSLPELSEKEILGMGVSMTKLEII